ncbi:type II toxin-antitoxin system RelE/ParE family toxin [Sulfitobacter sp. JB4-11]|uniref:type II toxin-antitoxin system RelE/ParE family toxin n=1 Tax=Sulfitobacter rhodophyticola TaxID=3238304 RepID=UPI0035133C75
MKSLRFSLTAERRLDEIFEWSYSQFGMNKALEYQQVLIETCERIASGVAHTQSCRTLVVDDTETDLRFARAGRHFIVYEEHGDIIGIADLLHSSSDLGTLLNALGSWEN